MLTIVMHLYPEHQVIGGTIYIMIIEVDGAKQTQEAGRKLGLSLRGGETIELVGDVGAGKTTFTKGLALGLGIDDPVQSPSFTISQVYEGRDGLRLAHYDFYRLSDPGIMADELAEAMEDDKTIVVIEWADTVSSILPDGHIRVQFETTSEEGRKITL